MSNSPTTIEDGPPPSYYADCTFVAIVQGNNCSHGPCHVRLWDATASVYIYISGIAGILVSCSNYLSCIKILLAFKKEYIYFVILEAHLKYSKHKQNREIRKSASRCKKHILHDSLSFLWTHTSYLITTDEGWSMSRNYVVTHIVDLKMKKVQQLMC